MKRGGGSAGTSMMYRGGYFRKQPTVRDFFHGENVIRQVKVANTTPASDEYAPVACLAQCLYGEFRRASRLGFYETTETNAHWGGSRIQELGQSGWRIPFLRTIQKPEPGDGALAAPVFWHPEHTGAKSEHHWLFCIPNLFERAAEGKRARVQP